MFQRCHVDGNNLLTPKCILVLHNRKHHPVQWSVCKFPHSIKFQTSLVETTAIFLPTRKLKTPPFLDPQKNRLASRPTAQSDFWFDFRLKYDSHKIQAQKNSAVTTYVPHLSQACCSSYFLFPKEQNLTTKHLGKQIVQHGGENRKYGEVTTVNCNDVLDAKSWMEIWCNCKSGLVKTKSCFAFDEMIFFF